MAETPSAAMRPCRACRALVYDLEHVSTRRSAPIDIKPNPKGNVLVHLEDGFYTIAPKSMLDSPTFDKSLLYTSHFFTCPYASQFRRPKDQRPQIA